MANRIKYYTPNDINAFLRGEADWTRQYIMASSAGNTPYGMSEISEAQVRQLAQQDPKIRLLGEVTREQLLSGATPEGQYVIGPNGNIMPKETAANYSPSPGEYARGIQPTGTGVAPGGLPKAPSGAVGAATAPTKPLKRGNTGAEVKQLQDWLVANKYMTQAEVDTGYGTYGAKTEKAVTAMQKALGVDNKTGPGVYGPRTIAKATGVQGTNPPPGGGTPTPGGGTPVPSGGTPTPGGTFDQATYDAAMAKILANPLLTDDQKNHLKEIGGVLVTGDKAKFVQMVNAFTDASKFSDPFFKAQVALSLDTLHRGMNAKEGDLEYDEGVLTRALENLKADTASGKEQLSFQHQQELDKLARSYEVDLQTTQDNMAATGFTNSSKRARAETILSQQNEGLRESANKTFGSEGFKAQELNRNLAYKDTETQAQLLNLQRLAKENKIGDLRLAEASVGSNALAGLDRGLGLVRNVGGDIARSQFTDAASAAYNALDVNQPYSSVF